MASGCDTCLFCEIARWECVPEFLPHNFFFFQIGFSTIKLKVFLSYLLFGMRKRTAGTIYLVIGIILSIFCPITSVSNVYSSYGPSVPSDPLGYWVQWFWIYGLLTITLALIGVYFVIFGYRSRKYYPKAKSQNNERRTEPD